MIFRDATADDLGAIVDMLIDDPLGAKREDNSRPLPKAYQAAFEAFHRDENSRLIVAEVDGAIAGCMQLHFLPGISHLGMWRGQIESVRVASSARGQGVGEKMIGHAIELFRKHGCGMVQLTSTASRTDARRFYERLGFEATHTGMKLKL